MPAERCVLAASLLLDPPSPPVGTEVAGRLHPAADVPIQSSRRRVTTSSRDSSELRPLGLHRVDTAVFPHEAASGGSVTLSAVVFAARRPGP